MKSELFNSTIFFTRKVYCYDVLHTAESPLARGLHAKIPPSEDIQQQLLINTEES